MTGDDATAAVIRALNETGIPYLLVGSYSSNLYGVPRSTQDADFCVQLVGKSLRELMARLGPSFRLEPQISFETVTGRTRHTIHAMGTNFKIELFQLSADPHDQERFRRRQRLELSDGETWIAALEDVIVMKLRWLKDARRSKDRDDLQSVIAVSGPQADWDYIHRWCEEHGTRALLDEIRASIPPDLTT